MSATALELRDLVLRRGAWSCAVPDLELRAGESVALVGPSGCGKTAVLLACLGLGADLVASGEIARSGLGPTPSADALRRWLRDDVAVVLQDAMSALDPFEAVGEQLSAATGCDREGLGGVLVELGVELPRARALLARRPFEVSGGEAQRCLVAVAVARRPRVVVADEPSASLDDASVRAVLAALRSLRDAGAAVLVATHDERVVEALGARPLEWNGHAFLPRAAAVPRDWVGLRQTAGALGGEVLALERVSVQLSGRTILDEVDLTLRRRELVAVVGASGAGKSTLARVAAGLRRPDRGVVRAPDRPTAVQMLFQDAFGSLTPGLSLAEQVGEVAAPGFDVAGTAAELGLPPALLRRTAGELSGGEARRVALLRALAVRPEVLVCDEPLASLDARTMRAVTEALLAAQRERGVGMLVFSHDRDWCRALADRMLELDGGRLFPCSTC